MNVDGVLFWAFVFAYLVTWVAAFVSFFRTPSAAWASDVERLLMLGWLVFWGVIGAAVWFFGVRPTLRERLDAMEPEPAPSEEWRLKHLA